MKTAARLFDDDDNKTPAVSFSTASGTRTSAVSDAAMKTAARLFDDDDDNKTPAGSFSTASGTRTSAVSDAAMKTAASLFGGTPARQTETDDRKRLTITDDRCASTGTTMNTMGEMKPLKKMKPLNCHRLDLNTPKKTPKDDHIIDVFFEELKKKHKNANKISREWAESQLKMIKMTKKNIENDLIFLINRGNVWLRGRRPIIYQIKDGTAPAESHMVLSIVDLNTKMMKLTDGWSIIDAKWEDLHITSLVNNHKIKIGSTIRIWGSKLTESNILQIFYNSMRPSICTKLGYQKISPAPCRVAGMKSNGGVVTCLDLLIIQPLPIVYREYNPEGGSIVRSEDAELHHRQALQEKLQEEAEELIQKSANKKIYETRIQEIADGYKNRKVSSEITLFCIDYIFLEYLKNNKSKNLKKLLNDSLCRVTLTRLSDNLDIKHGSRFQIYNLYTSNYHFNLKRFHNRSKPLQILKKINKYDNFLKIYETVINLEDMCILNISPMGVFMSFFYMNKNNQSNISLHETYNILLKKNIKKMNNVLDISFRWGQNNQSNASYMKCYKKDIPLTVVGFVFNIKDARSITLVTCLGIFCEIQINQSNDSFDNLRILKLLKSNKEVICVENVEFVKFEEMIIFKSNVHEIRIHWNSSSCPPGVLKFEFEYLQYLLNNSNFFKNSQSYVSLMNKLKKDTSDEEWELLQNVQF
eukprot:GHVL01028671.1.p1 GENE.GHVL01028671.1~~GHVL01028671.1.p1  ORF type:complete len:698 (+),score=184.20 GHVL01028671.1:1-2094(+)